MQHQAPNEDLDVSNGYIWICELPPGQMMQIGSGTAFGAEGGNLQLSSWSFRFCGENSTFFATIGAAFALMMGIVRRSNRNDGETALSLAPQSTAVPTSSEELPRDIIDLVTAISTLPADQRLSLAPLVDKVVESTRRRRRILNLVQDALGQLRLDMKYLIFDLEATRRERDALRSQQDEQSEGF